MPGQSQAPDDLTAASNKRRRTAHPYPTAGSAYGHLMPYNPPQHHHSHHVNSYPEGVPGHYIARQPQSSNPSPSPYHGTPTAHQGQWAQDYHSTPQAFVSHYQDPRSIQQPYYYGQTDPSVYNSPWPPPQHDTQSVSAPPLLPTNQAQTMPYIQSSQPPIDAHQGYDSGPSPSYATALHNFDVGSFGMGQDVQAQQPQVQKSPSNVYYEDASMHLKMQSLPILDSLATQLIVTIAKYPFSQIQDLMRNSDDEDSQAYTTLKSLFDQTRKVYSRDTPFIDAISIQMFQPTQQEIIRKANIATFISSILGAHDVSFFHLNEYFLETFVPLGHRLLKWQGAVYLELKTQAFISALMNSDTGPERMLDDLFPHDLDAQILTRHPDAPSLSPSEQDFIDRCRSRRTYLLVDPSAHDAFSQLPKKYQWADFVREFAGSISKNVDSIISTPTRSHQQLLASTVSPNDRKHQPGPESLAILSSQPPHHTPPPSATLLSRQSSFPAPKAGSSQTTTSSPSASSTRQPWTKPEEDALLAGLGRVSGPHWSQILALYGRGGSVSEVLKDRNQVQLKDKARNLKLWYLKTGREVPDCLRGVTGELRKRGGARARAALAAEEEAGSA
ncbi:hypothetical protein Q7P37_007230 [Cladosporium fusiforme]